MHAALGHRLRVLIGPRAEQHVGILPRHLGGERIYEVEVDAREAVFLCSGLAPVALAVRPVVIVGYVVDARRLHAVLPGLLHPLLDVREETFEHLVLHLGIRQAELPAPLSAHATSVAEREPFGMVLHVPVGVEIPVERVAEVRRAEAVRAAEVRAAVRVHAHATLEARGLRTLLRTVDVTIRKYGPSLQIERRQVERTRRRHVLLKLAPPPYTAAVL